jgi:hypothetical protein
VVRRIALLLEIAILSALIFATRCANYEDVFIAGNVYFTDADCYARMTRVRICAEHPGKIIRHHDFENFPDGTTPHTTAPLDYLILALVAVFVSCAAQPIELAGAFVSPLLALLTGWFLWWWLRRMKFRYRWVTLLLFALSPILAHGTELGRPDHQSLLLLLVTIALCAEWSLHIAPSQGWSLTSGVAWGTALWASLYEPLVLLTLLLIFYTAMDRQQLTSQSRRLGWIAFAAVLLIAFAIEQRIPSFALLHHDPSLTNWSRTIGELMAVAIFNPTWFRWYGWMLAAAPLLIVWIGTKRFDGAAGRRPLAFITSLFVACYLLTLWQTRWGYFFATLFALAMPLLLEPFKSRAVVWIAVMVSFFPVLQYWDARLWPNESELARRAEVRLEAVQWRLLGEQIRSPQVKPFLAPWWLSPAIAYWSGQPGVAGSSHESLPGIVDSARFCLTSNEQEAREILQRHRVAWVLAYDSDRVLSNSAAILNAQIPAEPLARVLDRTPSRAPNLLQLVAQDGSGKLYSVNYFP